MAVVQQPGQGVQFMAHPGAISGVPPGLEYLTQVDQLICKQMVELFEVVTGWECKNKYRIFNSVNQQVYFAFEESELCNRICCGPNRGFVIHITDNNQQEVLRIERPFECCKGCCWCAERGGLCDYPIFVKDAQGNSLGSVHLRNSKCAPHFGIYDSYGSLLYDTWGPVCPVQCICGCTDDLMFPLKSASDYSTVGNISKIWGGAIREMFTKADTFGLTFPINLDVKHKALMLGAIFIIEFMVFERQKKNNNNS